MIDRATAPTGYWAKHQTIVITWPGDLPGVPAIGRHQRRPNGDLAVEYTRDDLVLALTIMHELRSAPQVERPVFARLSQAQGRQLAQQVHQESLL